MQQRGKLTGSTALKSGQLLINFICFPPMMKGQTALGEDDDLALYGRIMQSEK
jgi:hypothetical protein